MARRLPSVVVVGAASRDLDPADPRGWRLGGTVTYASLAICRLGLPVRVLIGVDEEAAGAHELGLLLAAGAQIELARLSSGPVFDNQPAAGGRRQVAHSVSDPIPLRELPRGWRSADAVLLGPIAAELGPAWARAFPATTLVGLGWQGLMRRLVPGQPVVHLPIRPSALVRRADIAAVSAEDVAAGGAPLVDLLPRTGQRLAVSHASRAVLLLERGPRGLRGQLLAVQPASSVRDTTGAGDVLLGVWLAGLAAVRAAGLDVSPARALAVAIAAATAHVERGSLAAMPDLRALCARLLTPRELRSA